MNRVSSEQIMAVYDEEIKRGGSADSVIQRTVRRFTESTVPWASTVNVERWKRQERVLLDIRYRASWLKGYLGNIGKKLPEAQKKAEEIEQLIADALRDTTPTKK